MINSISLINFKGIKDGSQNSNKSHINNQGIYNIPEEDTFLREEDDLLYDKGYNSQDEIDEDEIEAELIAKKTIARREQLRREGVDMRVNNYDSDFDTSFKNVEKYKEALKKDPSGAKNIDDILPIYEYNKPETTLDTKTDKKISPAKIGVALAAAAGVITGGIAVIKHKTSAAPYVLKAQDTTWKFGNKTFNEWQKENFIDAFIKPIENGKIPENGFLVEGPESKGKEEFFEWAIDKLRKAGVEIIDTVDPKLGHSTKKNILQRYHFTSPEAQEQFQKDGKFKLFVVRKMEEVSPERNHRATEGILKDGVEKSAKKYGLILGYDMKDSSNFYPGVTRIERIDRHYTPMPLENDSLEVWKEWLDFVKYNNKPSSAAKKVEEARAIFQKKGKEVLDEMEPSLKYQAPYVIPKPNAKIESWKKYTDATIKDLDEKTRVREFIFSTEGVIHDYLYKKIPEDQYNSIIKMIRDGIPSKDLEMYDKFVRGSLHQRV